MKRTVTATESVHVSLGRGLAVFLDDPGLLFAETPTAEDRRSRRFRSVMSIDIGSGASMQQEVEVRVYAPRPDAPTDNVVLPLRLHASGHENLFPTFVGELTASPNRQGTQLTLRVSYTVPVGDRPDDAHESLTVFLAQIAKRLDTEVVRRIDATPHHPAPKPVSPPEQDTGDVPLDPLAGLKETQMKTGGPVDADAGPRSGGWSGGTGTVMKPAPDGG